MGVERKVAAAVGGARGKKASPPIFSHEFFIQNHGDIVSCVIMVIIVGFMFQATAPISAIFVAPQYNETVTFPSEYGDYSLNLYRNGVRDVFTVVFYTIAWITVHAIIQEYILDKLQRKVHLSKTKTTKFTESGHLLVFSVYSVVHAGYLLADFITAYSDLPRVWTNYPEEHKYLSMNLKMFFILQISYWVHQFPEFYFQKVKKEDARPRAFVAALFIGFISFAYVVNFTRLALVILLLEYTSLTVFHITRILHFLEKKTVAKTGFKIWNGVFVLVRIATAVLAVTTFWYGLRQSEVPHIDIAAGNFNTSYIRLNSLLAILILQLLQLWNFLSFHLGRLRDSRSRKQKTGDSKPSHQKKEKKEKHREEDELPEADQATAKKTTKKQKAN